MDLLRVCPIPELIETLRELVPVDLLRVDLLLEERVPPEDPKLNPPPLPDLLEVLEADAAISNKDAATSIARSIFSSDLRLASFRLLVSAEETADLASAASFTAWAAYFLALL